MSSQCKYYGDCPYNRITCEEMEPWYNCPDREVEEYQTEQGEEPNLNALLNAIKVNEEVCILSGKEDNGGAIEDRFRIEIAGPERLLRPLSDILFKGI